MITPKLDTIADIPLVEYPGSFDEANTEGCENFLVRHPEFFQSEWNATALLSWLDQRLAPYTLKNLEIAYASQKQAGLIEKRPPAPRPAPQKISTVPVAGGLAAAEPTDKEAAILKKLSDDFTLSDATRKRRFEALRRLAVSQRRQFPHGEPTLVIL